MAVIIGVIRGCRTAEKFKVRSGVITEIGTIAGAGPISP